MPSPLITRPGRTALLPPQYCGQVGYYALMATYPSAVIDLGMHYDKRRKSLHRCTIADVRGPLTLTVPIEKAHRGMPWASVLVSSHGCWWSDHAVSLESAYGRTPFFEFYYDRFKPLLAPPTPGLTVGALDCALDQIIRQILAIDTAVTYADCNSNEMLMCDSADVDDYRRAPNFDVPDAPAYYQVRADRLGFIPNLSILDLIFNLGPESPLLLHQMSTSALPEILTPTV